ncbi:MAG: phosphate regulon transcriptional regulatory protein PhoB [Pseudomonadota bacterium]|jgi:two-component system phosphate regulon response regulator PhoB
MSARILIVEDEPAIRELLRINLHHAGFTVDATDGVDGALAAINVNRPDLILLDWMMPGRSGLELIRHLRAVAATRALPIILITARAQEGDKLQGFDSGADDYITKPFSPREVLARIRALLRRSAPEASQAPLQIAGLRLEPDSQRVLAHETPLDLSPTEYRLLHCFMKQPDRVLSRAKLIDSVWGDRVYIEERTVDVHIRRLRLALAPSGHERLIETVRGGGYRFLPQ